MAYEQDVTREQIDQAASEHAAGVEIPAEQPACTTLAYGAEGEELTKLVDLLALLGFNTNDVIAGKSTALDATVFADLEAAETELGFKDVARDELVPPADIPVGVKGDLVTAATWDALYAAAAKKLAEQSAATDAPAGAGAGA